MEKYFKHIHENYNDVKIVNNELYAKVNYVDGVASYVVAQIFTSEKNIYYFCKNILDNIIPKKAPTIKFAQKQISQEVDILNKDGWVILNIGGDYSGKYAFFNEFSPNKIEKQNEDDSPIILFEDEISTENLKMADEVFTRLSKKEKLDELTPNDIDGITLVYLNVPFSKIIKFNTYHKIEKYIRAINRVLAARQTVINYIENIEVGVSIVPKEGERWEVFNKYISNCSYSSTQSLKLVNLYKIDERNKVQNYTKYTKNIPNKKFLFHGSPKSNWPSILKNGLRVDPFKEGIKTKTRHGKVYGNGVYFSDSFLSFHYAHPQNNIGVFGIYEVALGKVFETVKSESDPENIIKKMKCDSLLVNGKYQSNNDVIFEDALVPSGKMFIQNKESPQDNNIYVIFNTDQFILRYIAFVEGVSSKKN